MLQTKKWYPVTTSTTHTWKLIYSENLTNTVKPLFTQKLVSELIHPVNICTRNKYIPITN